MLAGPHQVHGQQAHPAGDRLQDVTLECGPTVVDERAWLLFAHAAATLYMTGVIWFVQIVHYPLAATCLGTLKPCPVLFDCRVTLAAQT